MTASFFADAAAVARRASQAWRPPPRLSLSQWADENFYLSAESAATPGRWHTLPYQRGILDAVTDPRVTHVSVMKSARVGYTKCVNATIGFHMHHAPCPILVVQPTIDDAKGYSKEEIAPMLRDCPELAKIVFDDAEERVGPRDSANTILHKRFPGGVLSMVGANSGAGFRRISRRVVIFDEVDAYPTSAGNDGDPIKLGTKRAEYYHDRKIIAGSTPLIAGASRIEKLFLEGDQRRFYVPCPHCGHFDHLVFTERASGGHWLQFDPKDPDGAHFVCSRGGCVIEHKHKRDMVSRGEWRASAPFVDHASFHIWAAYSFSPNATWSHLVREFLAAKDGGPDQLKTFVNTVLGETWQERGEAPDWTRLYARRETYRIGTVPAGVRFLTAGVDVQQDRWVYEVVGWSGGERETWSIDAGVIPGDPAKEADWARLDDLLARTYESASGEHLAIVMLAVDSGYQTQQVYNWGRRHPLNRVIAVKGVSTARTLISSPTPVDVSLAGQRIARGYKVWPVGVDVAKAELYGWLRLPIVLDGAAFPPGWAHFPEYGEDYFKQITAEHLVSVTNARTGFTSHEWHKLPGRENHYLDCRIYARAAAAVLGVDRMTSRPPPRPEPGAVLVAPRLDAPPRAPSPPPPTNRFQISGNRGKAWLSRKR